MTAVVRKARKDKKIDTARAFQLSNKGVPQKTIADAMGVSQQAICKALKPLQIVLPTSDDQARIQKQITPLVEYNMHRAVAKMVVEDDPKGFKDWSIGFDVLHKNIRLIQGLSTSNSSVMLTHIKAACQSSEQEDDAFSRDL